MDYCLLNFLYATSYMQVKTESYFKLSLSGYSVLLKHQHKMNKTSWAVSSSATLHIISPFPAITTESLQWGVSYVRAI